MKVINRLDDIFKGDIHIVPRFFDDKTYISIINKIKKLKLKSSFQPHGARYGNRMQGMPCYESDFYFKKKFIIDKIENILGIKINYYHCLYRKIKTKELKQSQCTGQYGFTHTDGEKGQIDLAAIMHFDQSYDGGTAFFENSWDKKPDIYVSAYPNRLVLYNANRFHAPAFDHSYLERHSLAFFFKVKNETR